MSNCLDDLHKWLKIFKVVEFDPIGEYLMSDPLPGRGFRRVPVEKDGRKGVRCYEHHNGKRRLYIEDDADRNAVQQAYDQLVACSNEIIREENKKLYYQSS